MKNFLALLFLALVSTSFVTAQKPDASSDSYEMGSRTLRLPGPERFVEISSQFPFVSQRLRSTEDPKNEALAIHVPESFVPKLKISEAIDLEFYTKISVNRQIKSIDVAPSDYAAVIATLEKQCGTYIDPKGSVMQNVESNSRKGLSDVYSEPTQVSINGVTNLGFFEKTRNVFSGMMLVNLEVGGRKMTTLGTFSVLHVNQRIVFVYVYKMRPTDSDTAMITDFTKKWTARIVAANN